MRSLPKKKMDWQWLFFVAIIFDTYQQCLAKEVSMQVNTRKMTKYLPDRFLGMTIDPFTIVAAAPLTNEALKMAKALSPCIVRIGGPSTKYLQFGKEIMKDNTTITGEQLNSVNKFVVDAGLDTILSLNPSNRVHGVWDSKNALDLISYSNKNGFSIIWQYGYDIESINTTGSDTGRDLVRLRKILDGFPKYAKSAVFAPDITSGKQMEFVNDMLEQTGSLISSLVIQPSFKKDEDVEYSISSMMKELDNHVWNKPGLSEKPVWIAESLPSEGTFQDAIVLIKRLGSAAKLGCQAYLRQPGSRPLKSPTPEFWASLLFKTLVGRGVLDLTAGSNNVTDFKVFSHCTPCTSEIKSSINKDLDYGRNAITVFGVNESPESITINLKASNKDEELHQYILTEGSHQTDKHKSRSIFLNGQLLSVSPTGDFPVLSPEILQVSKTITTSVPPMSIFFFVLPNINARICTTNTPTPSLPNMEELTKRIRRLTENSGSLEKKLYSTADDVSNLGSLAKRQVNDAHLKLLDDISTKYQSLTKSILDKLPLNSLTGKNNNEPETVHVKYITFHDNSWLNKLKETMMGNMQEKNKNTEVIKESGKEVMKDSGKEVMEESGKEVIKNNSGKYAPLISAIAGSADNEEKGSSRLKRATTIYPELSATTNNLEIKDLPDDIYKTLDQVQVTFSNLDDMDMMQGMHDINSNSTNVRRHIDESQIAKETSIFRKNLEPLDEETEEPEMEGDSVPQNLDESSFKSERFPSGEFENEEVSGTLDEKKSMKPGHIQKINSYKVKENPEDINLATEIMASPKEDMIDNILTDIITRENNEEPPLLTRILSNENQPVMNGAVSSSNDGVNPSMYEIPNSSPTETLPALNGENVELTDSPDLEEEIVKSDSGTITQKVLRQVSNKEKNMLNDKEEIHGSDQKDYAKDEDQTIKETTSANSSITTTNYKPKTLTPKIIFSSKDVNKFLEERREKLKVLEKKLEEAKLSLVKREDNLENIFKSFDKNGITFSPLEGSGGIQFVTSKPVNEDMISNYQMNPSKIRPRRLSQPTKSGKTDYYEGVQKHTNSYGNVATNSPQYVSEKKVEYDRSVYEPSKSENQYFYPLDSKTQGIVYNNKIYPAKLYGVLDMNDQQMVKGGKRYPSSGNSNVNNYQNLPKNEMQYVEKQENHHYTPEMEEEDYPEDGVHYQPEYSRHSRNLGYGMAHNDYNRETFNVAHPYHHHQPYIPVVVLTQGDKQYNPNMKFNHRHRRSIDAMDKTDKEGNSLDTDVQKINDDQTLDTIKTNHIHDLNYRYNLIRKLKKSLINFNDSNKNKDDKKYTTISSNTELAKMDGEKNKTINEPLNVCEEIGSSKESVIMENNEPFPPQNHAQKQEQKQHITEIKSEENDGKDKNSASQEVFTVLTDKFKSFFGFVQRMFKWNDE